MVVDEVIGAAPEVILEIGRLGNWIQAVGLIVIVWIIVQAITMYFNRRRRKTLYKIRDDLKRIERKVDRLLGRKRK